MDTLKFTIKNLVPFSTNKSKTTNRNGRYYKSTGKDLFQKDIHAQMVGLVEEMGKFKRNFDKNTEFLSVYYKWKFPRHKFYTKKGKLNMHRIDWDNTIKVLQDAVFKEVQINDAYILDGFVELRPSDEYSCTVSISKLEIDF